MPPPKTYNYTTNDVTIVEGNSRVFLDFRDSTGKFVPSFRENNICYQSYANKKFHMAKLRGDGESTWFNGAEFHFGEFQEFAEWIIKQKFYGYSNYELDKDLLHDGGVLRYSPETCSLIPAPLNLMIVRQKEGVSGLYGAAFEPARNKYRCVVRYSLFGKDGQTKFIGRFNSAQECHENFVFEKTKLIRGVVAESYKEHVDGRVYEKLKNWQIK